jgi:glycosyltransferase involved in cell wall biosynthesis
MSSSPLSVLIVIDSLDRGGAETHLWRTLPRLDRRRVAVRVFTLLRRGVLADALEAEGIPVLGPPSPRGGGLGLAAGAVRLVALLRRERPDIVHFFLPRSYLVGAPLAVAAGVRHRVMSRRSLHTYMAGKPAVLAAVERRLHHHMDALLGNSRAILEDLAEEGAPADRLVLLYNGIEVAAPPADRGLAETGAQTGAKTRAALGLDAGAVVLCAVANLIAYKGHADLVEACARLPAEPPWHLLLAGADPDGLAASLRQRAEALGIAGRVHVLGSRDDVPALLAASDIGVLASHEEGFPNAVLEYMAAGLPVVATAVGGTAEAVVDGETGHLVAPRDPAALAAALGSLAADPERRRRWGEAGRRRVAALFSLDASAGAYMALYERIAAGAAP